MVVVYIGNKFKIKIKQKSEPKPPLQVVKVKLELELGQKLEVEDAKKLINQVDLWVLTFNISEFHHHRDQPRARSWDKYFVFP